jgi:hypothetical protein
MDTEALVLFTPIEAERFERLTTSAATVERRLGALVIRTSVEANSVHTDLTDLKKILVQIEDTRKEQVAPLNEQLNAINGAWRPLREKLASIEAAAKRKLLAWNQAERERVAREQAEARRRQDEAQKKQADALRRADEAKNSRARAKALEAADTAGTELMEARIAEPMDAPTGIKTDNGTTSVRMRWAFKVVDPAQVPREFLAVDEKKIRAAVAQGARSIAGVSIYEEETLATRVVGG